MAWARKAEEVDRPCPGNTSPQITHRWPGMPRETREVPGKARPKLDTGQHGLWTLVLQGAQLESFPTPWLSLSPRALPPLPYTLMPAPWQQHLTKFISLSPPVLQHSLPLASGNHTIPSSGTRQEPSCPVPWIPVPPLPGPSLCFLLVLSSPHHAPQGPDLGSNITSTSRQLSALTHPVGISTTLRSFRGASCPPQVLPDAQRLLSLPQDGLFST